MAEEKSSKQYSKAIVFDIDGVLSHVSIDKNKIKDNKFSTEGITDEVAEGEDVAIFPVKLLEWFFKVLDKRGIKTLVGTQRLLALMPKETNETNETDKTRINSLVKTLDSAFGGDRNFLTQTDINGTVAELEKAKIIEEKLIERSDQTLSPYQLLKKNQSKEIILQFPEKEFKLSKENVYLIDDSPTLINDAINKDYKNSLYVYNQSTDLAPLFIVDIFLQELTAEEIHKEMQDMEETNKKNFITLLNLWSAKQQPKRPESKNSNSPVQKQHDQLDILWQKRRANQKKFTALMTLIKTEATAKIKPKPKPNQPASVHKKPEPLYKKILRAISFFPISLGELALRGILKLTGEPKNIVFVAVFNLLSLIFWPQRIIDQLPKNSAYRPLIRVANIALLTALIMFTFPPLAAMAVGVIGVTLTFSALPQGFAALTSLGVGVAEVAFGIAGAMYALVFQFFNRSDVVKPVSNKKLMAKEEQPLLISPLPSEEMVDDDTEKNARQTSAKKITTEEKKNLRPIKSEKPENFLRLSEALLKTLENKEESKLVPGEYKYLNETHLSDGKESAFVKQLGKDLIALINNLERQLPIDEQSIRELKTVLSELPKLKKIDQFKVENIDIRYVKIRKLLADCHSKLNGNPKEVIAEKIKNIDQKILHWEAELIKKEQSQLPIKEQLESYRKIELKRRYELVYYSSLNKFFQNKDENHNISIETWQKKHNDYITDVNKELDTYFGSQYLNNPEALIKLKENIIDNITAYHETANAFIRDLTDKKQEKTTTLKKFNLHHQNAEKQHDAITIIIANLNEEYSSSEDPYEKYLLDNKISKSLPKVEEDTFKEINEFLATISPDKSENKNIKSDSSKLKETGFHTSTDTNFNGFGTLFYYTTPPPEVGKIDQPPLLATKEKVTETATHTPP